MFYIRLSFKCTNTFSTVQNGFLSFSLISQVVLEACTALKERLDKVKDEMIKDGSDNPTWPEIVTKAYTTGVDLSSKAL